MIPAPTAADLAHDAEDDLEYVTLCQPRHDGKTLSKFASVWLKRAAHAERELAEAKKYINGFVERYDDAVRQRDAAEAEIRMFKAKTEEENAKELERLK